MSVYLEEQGYCDYCERRTLARGRGVNHVLHLVLSIFCCAVWPFVWGVLCLMPVDYRCTQCGGRARFATGATHFIGFALLGAGVLSVVGLSVLFTFVPVGGRIRPPSRPATTEATVVRESDPESDPAPEPVAPAKTEPTAKGEPSTPPVTPVRTVTLTPPTGGAIVLGESMYLVAEAEKSPARRDQLRQKGSVRVSILPFDVQVVAHEKANAPIRVRYDGKEWVSHDKWLEAPLDKPVAKRDPTAEKKPDPPEPRGPVLTPPKGESILLGETQYFLGTAKKEPEQRAKWLKDSKLKELTEPTEVRVIDRGKEYSKVWVGGIQWFVESRFLPAEKK